MDIERHIGRLCPGVEDHGQPVIVQLPGEGVDVVARVERLELPAAQSRVSSCDAVVLHFILRSQ
jgi:hypothetical protein